MNNKNKHTLPGLKIRSHNATPAVALSTVLGLCLDRHGAQVFKCQLKKLPGHGRALDVLVHPHLLRHLETLLRIYDTIGIMLGSQVSLEAHNCQRQGTLGLKGRPDFFDPLATAKVSGNAEDERKVRDGQFAGG